VINYVPSASTVYTTITSGGQAYTTTLATGNGSSPGTVEAVFPESTTTLTSYIPAGSPGSTSTISASGTISGTVIDYIPSAATVTTTITSGNSAYTTVLASGNGSSPGTVEYVAPVTNTSSSASSSTTVLSTSSSYANSSTTVLTIMSSSTTSTSATPSSTILTCPAANGTTYSTYNNQTYVIECGWDRAGGDLSSASAATFNQCMDLCANTTSCVDVSYTGTGGTCYMKSKVMPVSYNSNIWGARLQGLYPQTTTTSSAVSTTTSQAANTPATLANYTYVGCIIEPFEYGYTANNGRALSAMSVANAVSFLRPVSVRIQIEKSY